MSSIMKEMETIASMLSGKQKEVYEEMIRDAKPVKVVPLKDVFTEREIEFIKKVIKPQRHECYKNSFQLTTLFPDRVEYCEGKTTVKQFISIEHAWNKVGDKYVDITMELVLGYDMSCLSEDYVSFGEWNAVDLLELSADMEFYGGVYEHSKSKKYDKKGI